MSRVSVPVEVLVWVDVEDGTDEEVRERAHAAVDMAIPGADGRAAALFASDVNERIDYVTVIDADLDNAWDGQITRARVAS